MIDFNNNYNYLPIKNKEIFSRSNKKFNKTLNYFKVSVLLFLNLNKKKFIFKKLQRNKVINITLGHGMNSNKFDLSLNLQNTKIIHYIIYLCVMDIYLNTKNNCYL